MARELEGKTALVTGGGRGIGRAMAEKLAGAGAIVAINYAGNHAAAEAAVRAIEAAGGQAFMVQARIGDPGEIEKLVAALDDEFTRRTGSNGIDILINNIGGGGYDTAHPLNDPSLTLNPATAAARDTLYHNACHGCHGKDVQPYGGRGRTCGSLPSPSIEMRCGACCMMVRCSPRACRASPLTPRSRLGRSTLSSGQRRAELARQQAVPSTRP